MSATTTESGFALVDHSDVAPADRRVSDAYGARDAAIERVKVAQARIVELRIPRGAVITDQDRADREAALDEAGAANGLRAAAEVELHKAMRDRDEAVRRAVAPTIDSWRPVHAEAVTDAYDAVQVAAEALRRVVDVEVSAVSAVRHPSVRVSTVPRLSPSARAALEELSAWLEQSRS
jgi:hypothetical protein